MLYKEVLKFNIKQTKKKKNKNKNMKNTNNITELNYIQRL